MQSEAKHPRLSKIPCWAPVVNIQSSIIEPQYLSESNLQFYAPKWKAPVNSAELLTVSYCFRDYLVG